MRYCQRCLYPENHPLGIVFDSMGVCSGCRVHEEKDSFDWGAREKRLSRLLDSFRNRTSSGYDCVVPVSGARDSYFIVHTLKRRYGMNPLLVSYNRHFNTERGIRNLSYLRTWFDCDYMQMVVSPETVKRVTRETVRKLGSIYWHVLAGQTVWPVQVAVRLKIPLVVWGAHQGLDQVGMYSHADEVEMSRKYRCEHDLLGAEAEDLMGGSEGLKEHELRPWFYPHNRELSAVGVRGIYLGNFIPWDSKSQHEAMIRDYGYESAHQQRTFDTYNDVDCQHYSGLHDWIKFAKWGYGKVSDHASREIRLRRMTREQGIELVRQYRDTPPADRQKMLSWIGFSDKEFETCIDVFRDPRVWRRDTDGNWRLQDCVTQHEVDAGVDVARLPLREHECRFVLSPSRDPEANESNYVLMARGYVDSLRVRP